MRKIGATFHEELLFSQQRSPAEEQAAVELRHEISLGTDNAEGGDVRHVAGPRASAWGSVMIASDGNAGGPTPAPSRHSHNGADVLTENDRETSLLAPTKPGFAGNLFRDERFGSAGAQEQQDAENIERSSPVVTGLSETRGGDSLPSDSSSLEAEGNVFIEGGVEDAGSEVGTNVSNAAVCAATANALGQDGAASTPRARAQAGGETSARGHLDLHAAAAASPQLVSARVTESGGQASDAEEERTKPVPSGQDGSIGESDETQVSSSADICEFRQLAEAVSRTCPAASHGSQLERIKSQITENIETGLFPEVKSDGFSGSYTAASVGENNVATSFSAEMDVGKYSSIDSFGVINSSDADTRSIRKDSESTPTTYCDDSGGLKVDSSANVETDRNELGSVAMLDVSVFSNYGSMALAEPNNIKVYLPDICTEMKQGHSYEESNDGAAGTEVFEDRDVVGAEKKAAAASESGVVSTHIGGHVHTDSLCHPLELPPHGNELRMHSDALTKHEAGQHGFCAGAMHQGEGSALTLPCASPPDSRGDVERADICHAFSTGGLQQADTHGDSKLIFLPETDVNQATVLARCASQESWPEGVGCTVFTPESEESLDSFVGSVSSGYVTISSASRTEVEHDESSIGAVDTFPDKGYISAGDVALEFCQPPPCEESVDRHAECSAIDPKTQNFAITNANSNDEEKAVTDSGVTSPDQARLGCGSQWHPLWQTVDSPDSDSEPKRHAISESITASTHNTERLKEIPRRISDSGVKASGYSLMPELDGAQSSLTQNNEVAFKETEHVPEADDVEKTCRAANVEPDAASPDEGSAEDDSFVERVTLENTTTAPAQASSFFRTLLSKVLPSFLFSPIAESATCSDSSRHSPVLVSVSSVWQLQPCRR
ncbi:uncharacterized protein LOC144933324 [Lampetra fluviatilis]